MKEVFLTCVFTATLSLFMAEVYGQESPKEEDFFKILRVSAPEGVLLEVGGLAALPNGDLAVATRRGDIYIVENPTGPRPYFRRFAYGLHEVLGLAYVDGAFYCAQRGELTRLVDEDNDGEADLYETVTSWPLSGNYHEYSFGPKVTSDGRFFVTTNLGFPVPWWHAKSLVPWRGWALKVSPEGNVEPWATGMRSPAGLAVIGDDLFYSENQGDWVGSGGIWHLKKGSFTVHPGGLNWAQLPGSPVTLTKSEFFSHLDSRYEIGADGNFIKPENDVTELTTLADVKEIFPSIQLPAVWLPHGVLGISNTDIVEIPHEYFGPFGGQILVGDQGQSKIVRVFMEEVNGEFQGAAWDFRSGFQSGVLRMAWAKDGSLFVGETNRGWGSAGEASEGLQRLVWNGQVPFEMREVRAMPDGFLISFTRPVHAPSAEDVASYRIESFTYKYHAVYGSPVVDRCSVAVRGVRLSDDRMSVRIVLDSLKQYHIHELSLQGIRSDRDFYSLVHPDVYYTLNNVPLGESLPAAEMVTYNSAIQRRTELEAVGRAPTSLSSEMPQLAGIEIQGLLEANTCSACHHTTKRQIGPSFVDIAKRNYSNQEIIDLIHNPRPENWPDYSTPMPPMPHISDDDARKIAEWINTLK